MAETKKEISPESQSEVVRPFEEPLKKHLIFILILLALTIGVYSNSLFNGFLFDDQFIIIDNIFIKDWKNLPCLLSKDYFSRSGEATYRPVVTLSYFIDYSLWGLKPFGYHLTNVLIHSVNVVFVYLFALLLLNNPLSPFVKGELKGVVPLWRGNRWVAFLVALLFAVHPVLTEAVNAISLREDLLIVFFMLPAFLLFLRLSYTLSMDKIRWWTFYVSSIFLYLLALFSKEMAVTFPLLLIGYHICFKNKACPVVVLNGKGWQKWNTFIYHLSGYVVVTLCYLLLYLAPFINPDLTPFGYHRAEGLSSPDTLTRLLTLPQVLLKFLWLIIFPLELKADYVIKVSWSSVLFSILLLLVIGAAVFRLSKRYRRELFGLLWFFISLLPVMNIVPINNVIAERYLYLPFVGISLLFSSWLACLNRAKVNLSHYTLKREGITIIIGLIISAYGGRTVFRNMDWMDELTLWSKTVAVVPESATAHNNLGKAYNKLGLNQEAIREYQITIHLQPDNLGAYNNLGVAYASLGRWQEAIAEYQRVIEFKPNHPDAHYNMGVAYDALGRWQEAIEEYKKSLAIKPYDPDAHNNLGVIYYQQNRLEDALKEWEAALSIYPYHEQAKKNIEGLKAIMGRPP